MAINFPEEDWEVIVDRIRAGYCTPFLGAGASVRRVPEDSRGLPTGIEIAKRWASEYGLQDSPSADLTQIAQRMALKRDMMVPKDEMIKIIRSAEPPDFTLNDDPHGVLARDQTPRPQTGAV